MKQKDKEKNNCGKTKGSLSMDERKRYCKQCHKPFFPIGSEHHCESCQKFNNARCGRMIPKKKFYQNDVNYVFDKRDSFTTRLIEEDNVTLNGCFVRNGKDNTKWAIRIILENIVSSSEQEMIYSLIRIINHEYVHASVYLNDYDLSITGKLDSSNLLFRLHEQNYC